MPTPGLLYRSIVGAKVSGSPTEEANAGATGDVTYRSIAASSSRRATSAWTSPLSSSVRSRILERIEASQQDRRHAVVDVAQQRGGDRLGGPDQRRGVAARTGCLGDRGQEALVVNLAGGGRLEQPLRADALGSRIRREPSLVRARAWIERRVRVLPGSVLGGAEDRPHRDAEARRPALRGGGLVSLSM